MIGLIGNIHNNLSPGREFFFGMILYGQLLGEYFLFSAYNNSKHGSKEPNRDSCQNIYF